MEFVAAIAGIAAVLVSWSVGCKLLLIARRTAQAPEFLIGLGLLLTGGLWGPLMAVGRQATGLADGPRETLVAVAALAAIGGMSCIAIFNWRVFRPSRGWALALALAFVSSICGLFAGQSFSPGWLHFARVEQGPWTYASVIGGLIYTWSCAEAGQAWASLRRRQKLGLADAVVVDRMRLWMWMMLNSVIASIVFAACQQLGVPVAGTTVGMLLSAVAAGLSTVFLWLVFMPPASYLDAVRRRALVEA